MTDRNGTPTAPGSDPRHGLSGQAVPSPTPLGPHTSLGRSELGGRVAAHDDTSATVPTPAAADLLGVHRRTITNWTRDGRIRAAVPARGSQPARYEIAELHRLVREATDGHGPECPVHHQPFEGPECQCVACHCGPDVAPGGFLGACARCLRPRVEHGRVVR